MNKNANTNSNETRGPGRPPKTVKFPSKAFTVNEAIVLNSDNTCALTVRKQINTGVASGNLVRLAKNLALEGAGRPAFRFVTKAVATKRAKDANRRRKPVTVEPVTA